MASTFKTDAVAASSVPASGRPAMDETIRHRERSEAIQFFPGTSWPKDWIASLRSQ
jgi:hypothetical protein